MKSTAITNHPTLLGLGLSATTALLLLLAATPASAQVASGTITSTSTSTSTTTTTNSPGGLTVVSSESLAIEGDDDGDGATRAQALEIRVKDGEISVRHNGKEVPDARIVQKDGRVIILDENGQELTHLKLAEFGGPGGYFYRIGAPGAGPEDSLLYPKLLAAVGALGRGPGGEAGQDGEAPKVMIGVHMGEPGGALEKHLHLDAGKTTMITAVFQGLPAEQAGIGEFDIIVGIDGSDSADASAVREALQGREPGDTVTLRVIQAGEQKDIKVKLQPYDAQKMHAATLIGQSPDGGLWQGAVPLNQLYGDMKNWHMELPKGLEGKLWVTPPEGMEWKGDWQQLEQLQPLIQQHLHEALKNYQAPQAGEGEGAADMEKQLDRLDERLSHLEKLLQKLIDKQAKP